jgi:hypothetical protein
VECWKMRWQVISADAPLGEMKGKWLVSNGGVHG